MTDTHTACVMMKAAEFGAASKGGAVRCGVFGVVVGVGVESAGVVKCAYQQQASMFLRECILFHLGSLIISNLTHRKLASYYN